MNEKARNFSLGIMKKRLVISLLLLVFLALGGTIALLNMNSSEKTIDNDSLQSKPIFVPEAGKEILTRNEPGELRVRINPVVYVKHNTMQNLELYNLNKDRYLVCELIYEDEIIYTSDYIKEGEMLKGDVIKTDNLNKGDNEVTVAISSFALDKQKMGQTNVIINLVLD